MAEGLITDCRLLLSRFENHKSVRFETFCEIWREMNFSLIHWYALVFLKGLGHAILGNFSIDQMVIELTEITK